MARVKRGVPAHAKHKKILKKAVETGLIPPERILDEIPESEIFSMVFLPGFSTADKVTDVSGRGVGMDVVRRNIEAIRGTVKIHSVPGRGATFSMHLPITTAIIDGRVVRAGSAETLSWPDVPFQTMQTSISRRT